MSLVFLTTCLTVSITERSQKSDTDTDRAVVEEQCFFSRPEMTSSINLFNFKSVLTFMNPVYVFKFKSGWNVYELRIGVQTFVFFVYIDKVLV